MAECSDASHKVGSELLRWQRHLFRRWHRVRDGTISREQFVVLVSHWRIRVKQLRQQTADLPIWEKEKTPLAKMVRTAREILKVKPALWTFVEEDSIEPVRSRRFGVQ